MEIINKSIEELKPYKNNAKMHPQKQIDQIAESIKAFGFNVPILIDSNNMIIAGHGRYFAAKKLKMDIIPAILIDHLTEAQKRAFIIADNKLNMNTDFDLDILKNELEFLETKIDFESMGFNNVEMENIFSTEVKSTTNDFEKEFKIYDNENCKLPIVPEFTENYNCFVIIVKNDIDELFIRNVFNLEEVQANNHGLDNRKSNVIEVESVREMLCKI